MVSLIKIMLREIIITAIIIEIIVNQSGATIFCIFGFDEVNIMSGMIAKGN
jgi:hypothetical protein